MTTLADFRARVLYALGVTTSTERGFTDANVDEHVKRAVEEFSLRVPVEASADLTVAAGSRSFATSALVRPIRVTAAEYPLGQWPRALLDFDVWGSTVTLDHSPPLAAYTVRVYYTQQHLVDGTASTIAPAHETVIVEGATAFAVLARTLGAAQTREAGTVAYETYEHLRIAQTRLAHWRAQLRRLSGRVVRRRLFVPAGGPVQRSVVSGP